MVKAHKSQNHMCTFVKTMISTVNMCNDCAFHDKSVKLCTVLKHYIQRIFGYRDIADMLYEKMATVLSKWPSIVIVNAIMDYSIN